MHGALGDIDRALALDDGQEAGLGMDGHLLQLLHRRRTARIERSEENFLLVAGLDTARQLGGGRGFTRALQTGHQDDNRRFPVQRQAFRLAGPAQKFDQPVMDDLDDLLARRHRADHVLADGAILDPGDEILDHRQGDIGFQQRHADFAQRGLDVFL